MGSMGSMDCMENMDGWVVVEWLMPKPWTGISGLGLSSCHGRGQGGRMCVDGGAAGE